MKALLLILHVVVFAVARAEDINRDVKTDAKVLKELLRENWVIKSDGNQITLTSKFEVFHIGMISRGSGPPEFSNKTLRSQLLRETKPEKYVIRLRYERKSPRKEFEQKRKERQKAADVLNNGARTKDEYGKAGDQYQQIKVPRYRHWFVEIYREIPDSPFGRLFPASAVQKIGGAKEILDVYLQRQYTGND